MHEIVWDFKIYTYHPIATRRLDLVLINRKKRNYCLLNFAMTTDHRVKVKVKVDEKPNK